MDITELLQQEKELNLQLQENKRNQREIYTKEFVEKYGFDINDTIEWKEYNGIKKGVVSNFKYIENKPCNVIVNLFKKDGSVGDRQTRIWMSDLKGIKVLEKAKE